MTGHRHAPRVESPGYASLAAERGIAPVAKGLSESAAYLTAARLEAGGHGPASVRREGCCWAVMVPLVRLMGAREYLDLFV